MTKNLTAQSKAKPVLFSLLTLLSGIIIGSGITLMVIEPTQKPDDLPGPEFFTRRMIEHWTRELNLTPEQVEQMQPVADKHMKAIDEYRKEAQPKIRAEIDAMNNEILEILDDEQKQMFLYKVERMKRHFQEMRQRRGDGDRRKDGDRRGERDRRGNRDDWRRRRRGDDPNAPQFGPPPGPREDQFGPGPGPTDQPPKPEPESPEQPQ